MNGFKLPLDALKKPFFLTKMHFPMLPFFRVSPKKATYFLLLPPPAFFVLSKVWPDIFGAYVIAKVLLALICPSPSSSSTFVYLFSLNAQ